jgi:hypothetical protein
MCILSPIFGRSSAATGKDETGGSGTVDIVIHCIVIAYKGSALAQQEGKLGTWIATLLVTKTKTL